MRVVSLVLVCAVLSLGVLLAGPEGAEAVSARCDRRLRLVKRSESAADAGAGAAPTIADAVVTEDVPAGAAAFVETGDNVHDARSFHAGPGAAQALAEEARDTLLPRVDLHAAVADVADAPAGAAANTAGTAAAVAGTDGSAADKAASVSGEKNKKPHNGRDALPAVLPPSAMVKAEELKPKAQAAPTDPADAHDPLITRSKFDRRRYRTFSLPNGLSVLLVSDAKTSKAAVAMDIGQGHYGDPESAPGLAHFLEHMLFLGTKKYPQEDSYDSFLSMYGGSDNAYTDNENTNFYFDIAAGQLRGALDRFAQFFISPLLSESATGREMNAVDAEHSKNKQNDDWRETQLLQSFGYAGHPFHKFGTGSVKTLGNVPHADMRALLFKFYQRWYHAQNMRLVVLGKDKLSTLEEWVRTMFDAVPRSPDGWKHFAFDLTSDKPGRWIRSHKATAHNAVATRVAADPKNSAPAEHAANPLGVVSIDEFADSDMSFQKVFDPKHLGSVVYFKSVKDRRKLSLYWPLPHTHYDEKSLDYIAGLLSNQHTGSLHSYLKKKGWVLHMDAGVAVGTHEYDVIQVTARLTEKGLVRPAAILSAIYGYLRLMREKGVEEWRFAEMKKLADIEFAMKSKERPIRYVSKLARDMREYRARDILAGDYAYGTFNAAQVKALLSLIVPSNAITMISTSDMHRRVQLTQREKWYKTRYTQQPIPQKFITAWTGPTDKTDAPVAYPNAPAAPAPAPASASASPAPAAAASAPASAAAAVRFASLDDEAAVTEALDEAVDAADAEEDEELVVDAADSEADEDADEDTDEEDAVFLQTGAPAAEATPADVTQERLYAAEEAELERRLKAVDEKIKAAQQQRADHKQAAAELALGAGAAQATAHAIAAASMPGAAPSHVQAVDSELAAIDADLKRMDTERKRLDKAKAEAKSAAAAAAKAQAEVDKIAGTDAATAVTATPAAGAPGTAAPAKAAGPWTRTKAEVALREQDLRSDYHTKLQLPPANPFIPDDLTVHPVGANLPLSAKQVRPNPYSRKRVANRAARHTPADPAKRPAHGAEDGVDATADASVVRAGSGAGAAATKKAQEHTAVGVSFLQLDDMEHDPLPLPASRPAGAAATADAAAEADAALSESDAASEAEVEALMALDSSRKSRKEKRAAAKAKVARRRAALLAKLRRRLVPIERNTDQTRNPVIIHEHDKPQALRVWYHQDRVFKRPRVNMRCRLWSPLVYTNARTYTTAALWVLLLEDQLQEFSYQTGLAGFNYVLGAGVYGVDFGVSGYGFNTGFRDYARRILQAIAKVDTQPPTAAAQARFELVRTRLREQWINSRFAAPHAYSKYVADFVLHQPRYFTDQLAEELATLTLADVHAWHASLFTDVAAECFIHGNAAPRHAVTIIQLIKQTLQYRTISQPFALQYRGLRLVDRRMTKLPGQFTVSTVMPNPKDRNAALYNYYQFGQGTAESSLFANVLSMVAEKPAFHTLRTHEQLGYIVWALDDSRDGVQAFSIRIQSSTRSAEYLASRVRAFLGTLSAMARDMSTKQWHTLLKTLIVHKMKPALSLDQKTRKFWAHISNQRYRFDYYLTQAALIRRRLPRMKKYFARYVDELLGFNQVKGQGKGKGKGKIGATGEADFRMLSVQINPYGKHNKATAKNHAPKPGSNNINVAEMKRKIAEAAKKRAQNKKKSKAKAKAAPPRFSEAGAGADAEADSAAEAALDAALDASVQWDEDRESGELDSDTDAMTVEAAESDQVLALMTSAEDEESESAVDFDAALERLMAVEQPQLSLPAAAAVATPATAVAGTKKYAATVARPLSFMEVDTAVQPAVGAADVEGAADEAELTAAQQLGGDADAFAAVAHSGDAAEESDAAAEDEPLSDAVEVAEVELSAEAEDALAADPNSAPAVPDVSQLPVTVTLRRRGKKPRAVQLLLEHLKTVSDELPLYPMRGVGALPPVFDPNAGALLDDATPTTPAAGAPSRPPLPAEKPLPAPAAAAAASGAVAPAKL